MKRIEMSLVVTAIVMLVVALIYFTGGQIFIETDIPKDNDFCEILDIEWEKVNTDGSREKISVPGQCEAVRNEVITIESEIFDGDLAGKTLCFRSNKQDMQIYIDDELRKEYTTENIRVFGDMTVSMYVFVELKDSDAGKPIKVVTKSNSSYSGIFNTAYYGTKVGIWTYLIRNNAVEICVAVLMMILSIISIICGFALQRCYKRKVPLIFLAMALFETSIWLLCNSELRQLMFQNISTVNDMAFFMIMAIPSFFLIFLNEIQEYRYRKLYISMLCINVAVYVVLATLHLSNIKELADNFDYISATCVLSIGAMAITIINDFRIKQIKRYKLIAIGILGACLAAVLQIVIYLNRTIQFSGVIMTIGLTFLLIVTVANTVKDIVMAEKEKQRIISDGETKNKFFASMSHEIRTPINAIIGLNEMILRESNEDEIRQYGLKIQNSSRSLLETINDILDLSKIQSGKMKIIKGEYDLAEMINSLIDMIWLRAENKGLEFKVSVNDNLPSRLYGADGRIRQVIINLLTNAVKYTQKGNVELIVNGEITDDEFCMSVKVKDTGIGIKKEDINKLFKDYERIEEARNSNIEGTGLGMSITVQLLEMMGSKLQVNSVYGQGSEFSFVIKQKVVDGTPIGNFADKMKEKKAEYDYKPSFMAPDAKILVVDDIELNRYVLINLLKETKIQVTSASSGMEGLEKVKEEHFDIIFLDHMMPEMDGVETLERMKTMEENKSKDTPIIVLTSNALAGSKEYYIEKGFDDYISKPINQEKLENMIFEILPKELLIEYKAEQKEKTKVSNIDEATEELPQIEGIDWAFAMTHFKERDMMMDTLKNVYYTLEGQADQLDEYAKDLDSQLDNYRILVHSVKGISAMVGMTTITGVARSLEKCAIDQDKEKITAFSPWFTNEMKSMKQRLNELFSDNSKGKQVEDYMTLIEVLEQIKFATSELDIDTIDDCVEMLMQYEYSEEVTKELEKLRQYTVELNIEETNSCVERLQLMFRG